MSFSRDGKFILHDGRGSPGADVYLLAVDTGQDVPLAPHPAEEFAIGWSPDGDQILFGSDRTGTLSLWTLTVRNGQAQGEPRLVRADAGSIEPLGVTRSGAFYYWVSSGLVDIYTAAIDPERAAILEAPKPVPTRFVGSNRSPDWSRDGKYLLYQSTRPGNELVIVIRSLESGVERDLRTLPALRFSTPRWNATGDAILASGTLAGKKGIYRIDPQKGAAALAVEMPPDKLLFTPDWSGDGQTLYGRFDNFNGVQRMDVPTRTIRPLYNPADAPGPFAANDTGPSDPLLSPDGRELLFQQRDRPRSDNLLIVTPEGGAPRVLLQGRWPDQAFPKGSYAWTPDSRWILVVQRSSGQAEILVVPAQGGELRRTGIHMSEIQSLRAAPDGHHIVFEGGQAGGAVWVAENLF
jgi:Tol biopolymer transport system component